MTEPTRPDPVPAPPRAGSGAAPGDTGRPDATHETDAAETDGAETDAEEAFADLERRPVSEHVAVFEAEHARLQRELGPIDQL